jgi:hypothetical protein
MRIHAERLDWGNGWVSPPEACTQILRCEIKALWPNKEYENGIADSNADSDLSFSDLQRLLDTSIATAASELHN